ncbi:MAG: hypothetical protein IJW82_03955 [Clostridia bacterium]|nr:hypothetical protein [Clostridia bacterium]
MNDYELMKLSEREEEAVNLCDFTPDQIEALARMKTEALKNFKEKYFDFYDDIKDSSLKKQDW